MADDLQIIRTFANDLDASIGQAVLDAHGIDCVLIRDNAGGTMPWLDALHPIRLAVDAADVELAVRLLDGVEPDGVESDGVEPDA